MEQKKSSNDQIQPETDARGSLQETPNSIKIEKPPQHHITQEPAKQIQVTKNETKPIKQETLRRRAWHWVKHGTTSTDWLIVFLTAVIAGTSYLQWKEIRNGSTDTHTLAIAAKTQAEAASHTAIMTERQLEMSERPWVSADAEIISPFTFDIRGAHVSIQFILKNIGHSPAVGIWIETTFFILGQGHPNPVIEQKKVCDLIQQRSPDPRSLGYTLFPGDQISQNITVNLNAVDIKKFEKDIHAPFIAPTVAGCVDYKFEFSQGHHQTGFVYDVMKIVPANPLIFLGINTEHGNIPRAELRLVRSFIGGGYAD